MGADLELQWLAWDRDTKLDWKKGLKVLESLKEEDIDGIGYDKEELKTCFNEIKDAIILNTKQNPFPRTFRRDACILCIGNLYILFSGGMTWGDSSTDLASYIAAFRGLLSTRRRIDQVLEAVGFTWNLTDWKEVIKKILKCKTLQPALLGVDEELDKLIHKELGK